MKDRKRVEETDITTETIIADRFAVDFKTALPEFDTVGAAAYTAVDLVAEDRAVYALVQRPSVPRRDAVVAKLLGRTVSGLACPRGEGIAAATDRDGNGRRLITIVDRPGGGRVVDNIRGFTPFTENAIRETILPQLLETLSALSSRNIAHRSVSLRNLYYRSGDKSEIMLGECFSAPPAFHQSDGYEVIERAAAQPEGRGEGDSATDMFALGVTLLSLLTGQDLAESSSGPDLLEARIHKGSLLALGGGSDLGGSMSLLLKGLLEDNPSKRWTPEDVLGWFDGVIPQKSSHDTGWILNRPIYLRDRAYKDRRSLALAMLSHPSDAMNLVQRNKFLDDLEKALPEGRSREWLDRALGARKVMVSLAADGQTEDMVLGRVVAILFPDGPLCFGRIRVCQDGFGAALAMAFAANKDAVLNNFRALGENGRFGTLVDLQASGTEGRVRAVPRLSAVTRVMRRRALGCGLGRALYELNKSLPCQSPKVSNSHVDSLEKLLTALDQASAQGEMGISLVDPHIAAFIARHEDGFEAVLASLEATASRPEAYMLEMLKLMGTLQRSYYPHPLKNLAGGFRSGIKRAVDQFKSKSRRKTILEKANRLLEQGNLIRISRELDLVALRNLDQRQFMQASRYYAQLTRTIENLEQPFSYLDARIQGLGHRYAAIAGVLVLAVVASMALSFGGLRV
jgi:hypothetical protein